MDKLGLFTAKYCVTTMLLKQFNVTLLFLYRKRCIPKKGERDKSTSVYSIFIKSLSYIQTHIHAYIHKEIQGNACYCIHTKLDNA